MIDFLVWQGHSRSEVMTMTLRQLRLFQRIASKRLSQMPPRML